MEFFTRNGIKYEGKFLAINEAKGTATYVHQSDCVRCGGAGGWKGWPGYTCYRCGGNRKEDPREAKLYSAEKLAKLQAAEAKRHAASIAKVQAEKAVVATQAQGFRDANADLIAGMERNKEGSSFLADLLAKLEAFGSLTEGQMGAAKTAVDREEARKAQRAASQHVGEIGKRVEMVLKIEVLIYLPPMNYGWAASYINLCRDEQGNRIVYKGSANIGAKGEVVKVKATIDSHGERNGELQTIISRPKLVEVITPAPAPEEVN